MKTKVVLSCMLALLLSVQGLASWAFGESIVGIQTTPESESFLFTSNDIHTNTLNRVFYLSDNEIWFNFFTAEGRGALVCFDINGDYVGTLNVAIDGVYPSIMCINHVNDRMMIGYIDYGTNKAHIVVIDDQGNELVRKGFGSDVYAIQMVKSERGILFAGGIDSSDGMSVLYLTEVDTHGMVTFEYSETVATLEDDHAYVSQTLISSNNSKHYAIVKNGVNGSLRAEERLICLDAKGEKLWETDIDETIHSNGITICDGHIVVVGSKGSRDEYGCLINQSGTTLYYDSDGELIWQHCNDNIDFFYFVLAAPNGCYALSSIIGGQAYSIHFDYDGNIQRTEWLDLPNMVVHTSFALTDKYHLTALGKTTESLYIRVLMQNIP